VRSAISPKSKLYLLDKLLAPNWMLTRWQEIFLAQLERFPNSIASTTALAGGMGVSRVTVVSIGRALERKGEVVSFRHGDCRWAALNWGMATRRLDNNKGSEQ